MYFFKEIVWKKPVCPKTEQFSYPRREEMMINSNLSKTSGHITTVLVNLGLFISFSFFDEKMSMTQIGF